MIPELVFTISGIPSMSSSATSKRSVNLTVPACGPLRYSHNVKMLSRQLDPNDPQLRSRPQRPPQKDMFATI